MGGARESRQAEDSWYIWNMLAGGGEPGRRESGLFATPGREKDQQPFAIYLAGFFQQAALVKAHGTGADI